MTDHFCRCMGWKGCRSRRRRCWRRRRLLSARSRFFPPVNSGPPRFLNLSPFNISSGSILRRWKPRQWTCGQFALPRLTFRTRRTKLVASARLVALLTWHNFNEKGDVLVECFRWCLNYGRPSLSTVRWCIIQYFNCQVVLIVAADIHLGWVRSQTSRTAKILNQTC